MAPTALTPARMQLHRAAHIVQSHGRSLIIERDDDSHAVMTWDEGLGSLMGEPAHHHRLGVRIADLTLLWTDAGANILGEYPLDGRTLDEVTAWLRERLGRNAAAHTLQIPYELPEHPIDTGEPFRLDDPAALQELARWYGNADVSLQRIAGAHPEAGPVRCWPHHLDIATLLLLDGAPGSEEAVTIGVGLSPGDDTFAEPYGYVTPWPYPIPDTWPPLSPGFWYTDTFVAGVLTGTELVDGADAGEQQRRMDTFMDAAIAGCRIVLAGAAGAPEDA